MDLEIAGRRALVTAAAGGLGRAVVGRLMAEGAQVTAWDVDAEGLAELEATLPGLATRCVDLAEPREVEAGLDALGPSGPVTILVNITGGPPAGSLRGLDSGVWRRQFEQIVLPVVTITDRLLPGMVEGGWGRIVTSVSSGVIAPIPDLGLSNSLRLGLVGWSKTLAGEVARSGVTVNLVVPGRIATPRIAALDATRAERRGTPLETVVAESVRSIPAGRYGEPEEFAAAVAFLASSAAGYITGSSIRVDGGLIPTP